MSQFVFLQAEWTAVYEAANKAADAVYPDPRAACFYARRALELAAAWMYKHDGSLRLPYQDTLSALIHEPTFKAAAGEAVFSKVRVINTLGNRAVHSHRAIPADDALVAVRESMADMDYLMGRVKAIIGERDRLFRELQQVKYLKPYPSRANFIFCSVLNGDARELQLKLQNKGIIVRYFDLPFWRNGVRITVGKPEHTDALMKALREASGK